jgi:iron complex transport system substrate-binding protein
MNKNLNHFVSISLLSLLFACTPNGNKTCTTATSDIATKTIYAEKFTIEQHEKYAMLHVVNPWQGASNIQYNYALVSNSDTSGLNLKADAVIQVPIKRAICLSTTHVGFIDALGEIPSIVGISGANLINNDSIQSAIAQKKVQDIGYESSLNYELILSLKPDVIFAYGVGHDLGYIAKLRELGLKVVLVAEYLEPTPLAKAEWIKFVAQFYKKETKADSIFKVVDDNYQNSCNLVLHEKNKPKVLSGLPWKEMWYVAGGKSAAARLITDAGGDYIFTDINSTEGVPLNIENVYQRAVQADVWVNCGAAFSLNDISSVDKRLSTLPVYQHQNVYNSNARAKLMGGNDYFESGVVRPDIILNDLIAIFHPSLLPNHQGYYYRKLN